MPHLHHEDVPQSRISRHSSLLSNAPGRSFRLHPVSVQIYDRYILADRSSLARPCEDVHGRTSFMSSSLFLQQSPSCLVRLIWMVFEMDGRIVIFWHSTRPKMPFKVIHRKEVTHSNGSCERKLRGRKLANEMGRAKKSPWYTHRLMHRKWVTSELHDSYFRLINIRFQRSSGRSSGRWINI